LSCCLSPAETSIADARNIVVFGQGQFDRSPCGTGTCARMATLFSKGQLPLGQDFVNEGILGTVFRGRLVGEATVGKYKAVIPEITAQAFITGIQQLIIDPSDPLKYGFLI